MEKNLLTPQDVADILKIKKSTVYEMIKRGALPAKKMGKQLRILPESLNTYLNNTTEANVPAPTLSEPPVQLKLNTDPYSTVRAPNFIISGQDELLDFLLNLLHQRFSNLLLLRSYLDSYNGLFAMYQEQVDAATCSLWDYKTNSYNLPFVQKLFLGEDMAVYHIAKREIGFYVLHNNPLNIVTVQDLQKPGVTFVNQERGSGARVLIDGLLKINGIDPQKINGYLRSVVSSLAAASIIVKGGADVAIGTERVLLHFETLDFIPLHTENIDLVVRQADIEKEPLLSLLQLLNDEMIQEEIRNLKGYDISQMGQRLL